MTKKEKMFVDAYVNDVKRNQTAAAIAAGYSEKTAPQAASRLMKKDEIKQAIDERLKELHEQNTAQANEVIEFLTTVMRGENVDGFQKLTEGKPPAKDRLRAAEMLGKYYALFTDRTQIENDGPVVIIDDIGGEKNGD